MTVRPKRRKSNNNPYVLEHLELNNEYFVYFMDSNKQLQKVKVSYEIFNAFDRFELDDLKELMNMIDILNTVKYMIIH